MVTSELLYRAFEAVVTAHLAGVSFVHDTNAIKDRSSSLKFPAAGWNLPTEGLQRAADVYTDTFTLSVLFVDQTASGRTSIEMMGVHARMATIAKQCFIRFSDLYIVGTEDFQGVNLDLSLVTDPTFVPVWDEGTTMITGVTMTVTVSATDPLCVDPYFA